MDHENWLPGVCRFTHNFQYDAIIQNTIVRSKNTEYSQSQIKRQSRSHTASTAVKPYGESFGRTR